MKTLYKTIFFIIFCSLVLMSDVLAQENIQVGSTTRNMIVHAPAGIEPNRPLVINMHGLNQDAAYQQAEAQWEPIANAERFVVVYPNGINRSWDLSGTRDIDFILAIIDNMHSRFSIDRNRVYLSGFSMGGMMTYHAATRIADKIAAFGPVAGYPMGGPNPNSSRPIPIIHTHGTADNVVPYSGVQNNLNAWINRNGCSTNAQITDPYPSSNPNSTATRTRWGSCDGGSEIVLMTLEGKGHWWSMDVANGISTSREIWEFSKNFSLGGNSGGNTKVWLESECGNVGSLWNTVSDASASNGEYLTIQSGNTSTASAPQSSAAHITYNFTINESGTYTLWSRVKAPNANDDSFWVRIDGGSWLNWNNIAPGSTSWTWDDVNTYNLSTGSHTVTVAYREDGAQLDKLYLTNSGESPSGSGASATNCGVVSGLVNNGVYEIEFQTNSNKVLDLRWGEDANGAVLRPWDRNGGTAQQWVAVAAENGNWRFISRASASNRCIDLENGSTTNGTSVRLWDNYGNSAQAWQVQSAGNGYYRIVSALNGNKSWDVANCNMDGSQNLQIWDYYGTSCQLFKFNHITTLSTLQTVELEVSSIEQYHEPMESFGIYPNPTENGDFTILLHGKSTENVLRIYTVEGEQVYEQGGLTEGNNYISSGLQKGIYILKVGSDPSSSVRLKVE